MRQQQDLVEQKMRDESDSFGLIKVLDSCYWGAQTQRSLEFFDIGDEKMPNELIHAFALQKNAAAAANMDLVLLQPQIANAIIDAAEIIAQGKMRDQFPLSVWQTGSGTQTNMNLNEVIANIANQKLGFAKGGKSPVHPNDHVNMGQSSNDSFPTAMNIATVLATHKLIPQIELMYQEFFNKAQAWQNVIKIGRTHLQDATPVTLGQEFSAFASQIKYNITRIKTALHEVYYLAQGGTAVGTGLNSHAKFPIKFVAYINKLTGLEFKTATNKFEALASHDGLVNLSGALNTLAASLMKIANDIRLLASGPRCGIGELHLPENEPGSSIMPGKVNPTQSEALTMICAQVMGNHATISIAGANGHLQLNVFKPVIIYNLLQSINLLKQGIASFTKNCLVGIEPNYQRIQELTGKSLMLVTVLNSKIGYDNASKITKYALLHNLSLRDAAIALNFLTAEEFDSFVQIHKMLDPAE